MNKKFAPLISVITVSYNASKTIEKTILSVLKQTYTNVEYIIIDGGSTDATVDIISKYKNDISVFISEKDEGISDAFNKGIGYATGELIGIINADDWYEKDACEIMALNYSKRFDVYYGNCNIYDFRNQVKLKKPNFNKLNFGMSIYHPSCFITKRAYEISGLYSKKYALTMDYDLLLRLKNLNFQFKYIDKTISNFRLGGISNSFKKQGLKETLQIKNDNKLNCKLLNYIHYIKQFLILEIFLIKKIFYSND